MIETDIKKIEIVFEKDKNPRILLRLQNQTEPKWFVKELDKLNDIEKAHINNILSMCITLAQEPTKE